MSSEPWWPFVWRGLRAVVMRWGMVVVAASVVAVVAAWLRHEAMRALETLRSTLQQVVDEERDIQTKWQLVEQHLHAYRQWRQVQLVDAMPLAQRRALWAEQLQAVTQSLGPWAMAAVTFELLPPLQPPPMPVAVAELPQGQQGILVSEHPLRVKVVSLHDIEALRVWQTVQDALGDTAHPEGCDWRRKQGDLQMECDWRLYYIQLPAVPDSVGPRS